MKPIATLTFASPSTRLPRSLALLFALCGASSFAEPIELDPIGLPDPESTITFSEPTFADMTRVSEEFADLGVTFVPNLYYRTSSHPDWATVEGPNLRTGDPEVNPFSVYFESPQESAALVAIAQPPTPATFTAKLNGVEVETFQTTVSIDNPNNFFGFRGIVFDEIEISYTAATRLRIDNIQLGSPTNVEPPRIVSLLLNEANGSRSATVVWRSRPRRIYSVFASDDLATWNELDDGVESGGEETAFTEEDISPEGETRFYRVEDTTG